MTESYGDLQEYKGPRRITIYTADLCPWMLRIDNGPQYIYVYIFRASAAGTCTEARMTSTTYTCACNRASRERARAILNLLAVSPNR